MSARLKAHPRVKGIYLRGHKYWYRFTANGEQIRVPLHTDDEIEAIAKAQEIRRKPELAPIDSLMREISAYVSERTAQKRFTARTGPETERVLGEFATAVDVRDPQRVTTDLIMRWYRSLKLHLLGDDGNIVRKGVNEDSAQTYVARVAGFFRWLVDKRKLRHNPMVDIELDAFIRIPRRDFCTFAVRDHLISACSRDDLKFCLYAGFHAGMRKGEIIEAKAGWFDLEQDVIHIPVTQYWHPKGKKGRDVPLTKEFKAFLVSCRTFSTLLRSRDSYLLHPKVKQGRYRYRWDFRRPFDDYVEEQALQEVYPHMMRKTFGSLLASRGVSLFKIASWLGDDIRTTQRNYAWLLPKDDEIEKAFSGAVVKG